MAKKKTPTDARKSKAASADTRPVKMKAKPVTGRVRKPKPSAAKGPEAKRRIGLVLTAGARQHAKRGGDGEQSARAHGIGTRTASGAVAAPASVPPEEIENNVASPPSRAEGVETDVQIPRLKTDGRSESMSSRPRQTYLSAEDLQEFREMLIAKRRELVGDVTHLENEAMRQNTAATSGSSSMPIHMADLGSDTWEQELTLGLIENERGLLREIDAALARIENRTYGICLATNKPIGKARLRAQPWAKFCIEYARKRELGLA